MSRNRVVRTLQLLFPGVLLASVSFAQVVTATLTGSITDSSGASVPNATVKVTEQSTGVARSSTTSVDGVYNVPYLNPGVYKVEVDAAGFKKYSQENVRLDVSTTARLDATLTPGSPNETVTVTAEAPALHVDAAAAAALLAIEKAHPGIYNIAEPSGYLATEKAQRELGFDPSFRLDAHG